MSRTYIPDSLRKKVAADARHRCGYCLTAQVFTAMPMHIEHIIPLAGGGTSDEANLWLACPLCNGYKATQTHHPDPESGASVPIFNPRRQHWGDHFEWSEDSLFILGKTACGRATILALKLNNNFLTRARRRWVMAGWHPPGTAVKDDL